MTENRRPLNVYGYCIIYRQDPESPTWTVDQDDEYFNLPAHYLAMEEALDRVAFLRERGVEARVASLLAEDTDEQEQFGDNGAADDE